MIRKNAQKIYKNIMLIKFISNPSLIIKMSIMKIFKHIKMHYLIRIIKYQKIRL